MSPKTFSVPVWSITILGIFFLLLIGLPVAALLIEGLSIDLPSSLLNSTTLSALVVSFWTTAASLIFVVITGTPLAFLLARTKFRSQALVELLVDLPIVLPPSVAGLALLLAFGRQGLLGSSLSAFGITLPFTGIAVVIAQIFVAGPLFVRSARIGFAAVDRHLEEAAFSEGANRLQLFRYVMVPVAFQALVSGALLSWARALGEFGATILFAGNLIGRTQTMPLAIYISLESDRNSAIALSLILLAISALFLWLLRRLERSWPAG